jgi:murein DD-endopeptidase MepM/ murein hydrolase activator NlpD
LVLAAILLAACESAGQSTALLPEKPDPDGQVMTTPALPSSVLETLLPPTRVPGVPLQPPTPDPPRSLPEIRDQTVYHVVQPGDILSSLAIQYSVGVAQISAANDLSNPDLLEVGITLEIPPPVVQPPGPDFKSLPDSALVYGPAEALLDISQLVEARAGFLAEYQEQVEDQMLNGVAIVEWVAQSYSVSPSLLLALLEHQSGWVTQLELDELEEVYPLGYIRSGWEGLYRQLTWAADQLNTGFYRWRAGWSGPFLFADGTVAIPGAGVNAGTVAVQYVFSQLLPYLDWYAQLGDAGFYATYSTLFGDPFERAVEPLVPDGLTQPALQLPFEQGAKWSFTGGPHSVWGQGAAWGGLDFAPPGDAWGCVSSDAWVVAVGDGMIIRAGKGQVLLDLDGDGYEQTGWVLLYLHIETRDRVEAGSAVRAGERIGHPSCEGGPATGTHLHIARKYNGEWIPADGELPFDLDGWRSAGLGVPYDGLLIRGGESIEACACRSPENEIER